MAIQAKVRSRQSRHRYRLRHSALLIIQALFRGWRVRSKVEQCWTASPVMQASIRYRQAQSLCRARLAALPIIQVSVRSRKPRIITDTHVEGDIVGLEPPQRLHPAAGADIAQDHGDQDRLHPAAESAAPDVPHAPVYARDSRSVGGHHGVAGSVVGKPGGSGESGSTPVLQSNLHGHHASFPTNVDTAPKPRTIPQSAEDTNRPGPRDATWPDTVSIAQPVPSTSTFMAAMARADHGHDMRSAADEKPIIQQRLKFGDHVKLQIDPGAQCCFVGPGYHHLLANVTPLSGVRVVGAGGKNPSSVSVGGLLTLGTEDGTVMSAEVMVVPDWENQEALLGDGAFSDVHLKYSDDGSHGTCRYSRPEHAVVKFRRQIHAQGSLHGTSFHLEGTMLPPSLAAVVNKGVYTPGKTESEAQAAIAGFSALAVATPSRKSLHLTLRQLHIVSGHVAENSLLRWYDAGVFGTSLMLTCRKSSPCIQCALVAMVDHKTNLRSDTISWNSTNIAPQGAIAFMDSAGPVTSTLGSKKGEASVIPAASDLSCHFNVIVDGGTDFAAIKGMKSANEASAHLKQYWRMLTLAGRTLKLVIVDAGSCILNKPLEAELAAAGIKVTRLERGFKVGAAERTIQTIRQGGKKVMITQHCSLGEWLPAYEAYTARRNVLPRTSSRVSRLQALLGTVPHWNMHLAVNPMAIVVYHAPATGQSSGTLDTKGKLARFVKYEQETRSFKVLELATSKVRHVREVKTFEDDSAELMLASPSNNSVSILRGSRKEALTIQVGATPALELNAPERGTRVTSIQPLQRPADPSPRFGGPAAFGTGYESQNKAIETARASGQEKHLPDKRVQQQLAQGIREHGVSVSAREAHTDIDKYTSDLQNMAQRFHELSKHADSIEDATLVAAHQRTRKDVEHSIQQDVDMVNRRAAEKARVENVIRSLDLLGKHALPPNLQSAAESASSGDQDRLHPAAESAAPNVPHAPVYARDSRSVGGHHGVAGSVVGKPGGSGESGNMPAAHLAPRPANVDTALDTRTTVGPEAITDESQRDAFETGHEILGNNAAERTSLGVARACTPNPLPLGTSETERDTTGNGRVSRRAVDFARPCQSTGQIPEASDRRDGERRMATQKIDMSNTTSKEGWRRYWNPRKGNNMIRLVHMNAPCAYKARAKDGTRYEEEYNKYSGARTLQEAVRLGAGKHLAYDVSHNNLIVFSSDGSGVPEDDDWSADGGPATHNIVAEAAAEAGITCLDPSPSTRGGSSLSADLLRPPPPPAAEDEGSGDGPADAIDHALQANSARAHSAGTVEPVVEAGRPPPVPPHTPIPPAQLGPRTRAHVDHTSTDPTPMAGWAPRHNNDTHRLGVLNPDLDAWDKADRDDLKNYRKFGALQSISKSDLPAGALKAEMMCTRVYKDKMDTSGVVHVVPKSRHCIRGDKLQANKHYYEVSSHSPTMTSIRLVVSLAASANLFLGKYDVTAAHLQGERPPDSPPVWIDLPKADADFGVVDRAGEPLVGILTGNVFGMNDANLVFEHLLHNKLREMKGRRSSFDSCLWDVPAENNTLVHFIHQADDFLAAGDTEDTVAWLFGHLGKVLEGAREGCYNEEGVIQFPMNGMMITQARSGFGEGTPGHNGGWAHINAQSHIKNLTTAFGFGDARGAEKPFPSGYKFKKEPDEVKCNSQLATEAHALVGGLLWVMVLCRFDITGQLAALQAKVSDGFNPDDVALGKRTLRYLQESQWVGPLYRENMGAHMRNKLIACADSAHNPTHPAVARAGGLILLNGAPIDAKSNRTDDSADSPGATETTGLHIVARRVLALRERAEEMGISQIGPTPIFDDSTTTISQVTKGAKMSRHILARIALIKGAVDRGEIAIKGIPGTENPADLLTKVCFKGDLYPHLTKRMGYVDLRDVLPEKAAVTKDSRQTTESATHVDQDRLHPAAESAAPNVPHAPVYARDSRSVGGHHGVAGSVVGKPGGSGESGRTPAAHPAPRPANVDTAPKPRTTVQSGTNIDNGQKDALAAKPRRVTDSRHEEKRPRDTSAAEPRRATNSRYGRSGPRIRARGGKSDKGIDTDYGIVTSLPQGGLRESREDPKMIRGGVPVWRACRPD